MSHPRAPSAPTAGDGSCDGNVNERYINELYTLLPPATTQDHEAQFLEQFCGFFSYYADGSAVLLELKRMNERVGVYVDFVLKVKSHT